MFIGELEGSGLRRIQVLWLACQIHSRCVRTLSICTVQTEKTEKINGMKSVVGWTFAAGTRSLGGENSWAGQRLQGQLLICFKKNTLFGRPHDGNTIFVMTGIYNCVDGVTSLVHDAFSTASARVCRKHWIDCCFIVGSPLGDGFVLIILEEFRLLYNFLILQYTCKKWL